MARKELKLEDKVELFKREYSGTVKIDSNKNVLKVGGTNHTLSRDFTYNGRSLSFEVKDLQRIASQARLNGGNIKDSLQRAYTAAVYDKIKESKAEQTLAANYRANQRQAKEDRRDSLIAKSLFGVAAVYTATLFGVAQLKTTPEVPYQKPQEPVKIEVKADAKDLTQYDIRKEPTKEVVRVEYTGVVNESVERRLDEFNARLAQLVDKVEKPVYVQRPTKPVNVPEIPKQAAVNNQPTQDLSDVAEISEAEEDLSKPERSADVLEGYNRERKRCLELGNKLAQEEQIPKATFFHKIAQGYKKLVGR